MSSCSIEYGNRIVRRERRARKLRMAVAVLLEMMWAGVLLCAMLAAARVIFL